MKNYLVMIMILLSIMLIGCNTTSNKMSRQSNHASSNFISNISSQEDSFDVNSLNKSADESVTSSYEEEILLDYTYPSKLGYLYLDMTQEKFLKIITEKPQKKSKMDYDDFIYTTYTYNNLEVSFYNNSCCSIITSRSNFATPEGLIIGDTPKKVLSLYGEPQSRSIDCWGYSYSAYDEIIFQICFIDGKVTEQKVNMLD